MTKVKTKTATEFGDFQTPRALAEKACALLAELGVSPESIIEPTCGVGNFLLAAAERWPRASRVLGREIDPVHLNVARERIHSRSDSARLCTECGDAFDTNWRSLLDGLAPPLLIIGNPPWVTNAEVGAIGGKNLPAKSNFQGHAGLDAMTGKANFDISEWILLQLAEAMNGRYGVLAMLVKSAVARKLLLHCWKGGLSIADAKIFRIDAMAHFDVAVDACLIVLTFGQHAAVQRASVYAQLSTLIPPQATIGIADGVLVADLDAYEHTRHLRGTSRLRWRSGIKHDCSKVMELQLVGTRVLNGRGEDVDLEETYLFPLLKTSEVAAGRSNADKRFMLVPQRVIGEPTADIAVHAPKTWAYLQAHKSALASRRSSIYYGKPEFSIFGVGEYSFTPWKIAISGLYKSLQFTQVGPCNGKPVVFDDTTNFLPCRSQSAASLLKWLLTHEVARSFYRAFIFWDAKRPITVELLCRLDLHALAAQLGCSKEFEAEFGERGLQEARVSRRERAEKAAPTFWPS